MKGLLILCLCLLVVVSAKHQGNRSKKNHDRVSKLTAGVKIQEKRNSDNGYRQSTDDQNFLMPLEELLLKFRTTVLNIINVGSEPIYPAHGEVNRRNRKQKITTKQKNRLITDALQGSLDSLALNFNLWIDSFEKSPESMELNGFNLFLNLFANWDNKTNHFNNDYDSYEERKLKPKTQQQNAMNEFLVSLKNLLSVLIEYINSCKGQEMECLLQFAQCMKEQQEKEIAKKRYGPDHNYLLDAVKDLAEYLEAFGDPEDEDILLLAQAINHLFEDVNILIANTPSVETNVLVLVDLYNVLTLVDNCKQNQLCYNDWYHLPYTLYT